MSTSWPALRDAFQTRLKTISGLSAHDVMPKTASDKDFAVVLYGEPLVAPSGHAGKVDVLVRIVVRCFRGPLPDAQNAIDQYLWPSGASSIVAAIYADRTLGGIVDDTQWVNTGTIGVVDDAMQAEINFRCKVNA